MTLNIKLRNGTVTRSETTPLASLTAFRLFKYYPQNRKDVKFMWITK